MIRIAIPIWLLAAPLASAQETTTTVKISILGENGAEEVAVGPNGGRVPYTIFVETDPLGTPGNFGLARLSVTIDTDTATHQMPISQIGDAPFDLWIYESAGCSLDDDLIGVSAIPRRTRRPTSVVPNVHRYVGQSGPQAFARGELTVEAAPAGSVFHAKIFIRLGQPASTSARVWTSVDLGLTAPPAQILGNTLTIRVGDSRPSASQTGDMDDDGDVDLADYMSFLGCFRVDYIDSQCRGADLDGDGNVDLADFVAFQAAFTGSH